LIVEANKPLGGFGDLCSVIVALSLIANMVPANYACGIDCQALGHLWEKVPRIVWNTLAVMVPMVLAIVGREHLADVFTNFLALMGYWTSVWLAMIMEEHLLFRRLMRRCWNWKVWDDRGKLPLGIAATVAFLVGWAGAVLCMAQVWYVGPLAKLISDRGGDVSVCPWVLWRATADDRDRLVIMWASLGQAWCTRLSDGGRCEGMDGEVKRAIDVWLVALTRQCGDMSIHDILTASHLDERYLRPGSLAPHSSFYAHVFARVKVNIFSPGIKSCR
jgi:hypothetical protein